MLESLSKMDPKQAELLVLTQVRKNLGHTHTLQKMDFEIRVQVNRLSDGAGRDITAIMDQYSSSALKSHTHQCFTPAYQLRAGHEMWVQDKLTGVLLEDSAEVRKELMRKNYIYPNGGSCRVEFTHPVTGKVYVGESFCHFMDQFDRKKSQLRAWGRIYHQMLEDSSFGLKAGKRIVSALIS